MTYDHQAARTRWQPVFAAAEAGDAHAFALGMIQLYAARGDSLASLQDHHGGGMGPCYAYEWQGDKFTVTAIGPGSLDETRCRQRFLVKRLYDEAQARIAGVPQQSSLWESEQESEQESEAPST